ncbi:hypothetical protein C0992_000218, partial [Termitomyces sp. T32_za158]
ESHQPIYGAVKEFAARRRRVNAQLLHRIMQIYALPGFTGIPQPGIKKGCMRVDSSGGNEAADLEAAEIPNGQVDLNDSPPDGEEEDDDEVQAFDAVINFIGNLQ